VQQTKANTTPPTNLAPKSLRAGRLLFSQRLQMHRMSLTYTVYILCNTLQHTATHCNNISCRVSIVFATFYRCAGCRQLVCYKRVVRCVAVLQRVVAGCKCLRAGLLLFSQRLWMCKISLTCICILCKTLQHPATQCNTMKHTAIHCNTLHQPLFTMGLCCLGNVCGSVCCSVLH